MWPKHEHNTKLLENLVENKQKSYLNSTARYVDWKGNMCVRDTHIFDSFKAIFLPFLYLRNSELIIKKSNTKKRNIIGKL